MNILLVLLGIIAFIIILILLILYVGIKITIKYKKIESQLIANLSISILKIKIIKKEYDSSSKNETKLEDEKKDKKDKDEKSTSKTKEEDEKNKKEDRSTKKILKEIKEHLPLIKELIIILLNYLIDIIHEIKIKKLNSHLKLGLTSYTETAMIVGWIWTITVIPNTLAKAINLTAEPQFTEEVIDFNGEIEIEIKTLGVLIKTLKLLFKRPIRQLIKEIIKYKRNNKKEKTNAKEENKETKKNNAKEENKETKKTNAKEENKKTKEKEEIK